MQVILDYLTQQGNDDCGKEYFAPEFYLIWKKKTSIGENRDGFCTEVFKEVKKLQSYGNPGEVICTTPG